MRSFFIILLGSGLMVMTSCAPEPHPAHQPEPITRDTLPHETVTADSSPSGNIAVANDKLAGFQEPARSCVEFLLWYRDNVARINRISLVDKTGNYKVNDAGTQQYLDEFRKSGRVSEMYIAYWDGYFRKAKKNFESTPQKEGPPRGFDYDFVMMSQHYDADLAAAESCKASPPSVHGSTQRVVLELPVSKSRLEFALSHPGDRWLVDGIRLAPVN